MEFLKRVELFVTDENSPPRNLLVSNLQFIRDKYRQYKADSSKTRYEQESREYHSYMSPQTEYLEPRQERQPLQQLQSNNAVDYIDNLYSKFFNDDKCSPIANPISPQQNTEQLELRKQIEMLTATATDLKEACSMLSSAFVSKGDKHEPFSFRKLI